PQLGGELHAGRRGSHDEHAAFGELSGLAVVVRGDLLDLRRHGGAERRHRGQVAGPARDDHRPAVDLAVVRRHAVAVAGAPYGRDVRTGADGGAGVGGEAFHERGHLPDGHVAVGVRAVVAEARQAALPVGGEQAEGVPALAAPGVRHLAAFQHHVVDGPLGEEVARGEARVTGAYDDGGGVALDDDRAFQAASTVTSVGLVRASSTAERFWDWATRASISCLEASASMVKVTLMSLKPLRTSLSAPRMPRMSCEPSSLASTERSWMPRFWATEATPAVRQLARPTRRYSIGVMALSWAANVSGWSASRTVSVLWLCSSPRP